MKFNQIYLDDEITKTKGIKDIKLTRLNNVVALVGKNGAGKTRVLDLLEAHLFESLTASKCLNKSVVGLPQNVNNIIKLLEPHKSYILNQQRIVDLNKLLTNNPTDIKIKTEIQKLSGDPKTSINPNYAPQVRQNINKLKAEFELLRPRFLRRIKSSEIQKLERAIDSKSSGANLTFENLIEKVSENAYDELTSIHKTGLVYLAKLPQQLTLDFMDSFGDKEVYEKKIAHKRFLSLKKLIKDFLNKDLTWEKKSGKTVLTETGVQGNYSGIWKLDGREFNYQEFSDGERTLFSYALLFFLIDANPNLNIRNSIILVDEPELHLHPDSEIDLINGIRNAIGENGQLFFATHSINILSCLNYDEIFMVKNGAIKHPSQSTLGESLTELMSLEDRVERLTNFISSIATWTFVNFMTECFANPDVIESSKPNDPQFLALKQALKKNSEESTLLLDFGAGKGRIYEQMQQDDNFLDNVSYSALEPDVKLHENLKNIGIKKLYKDYQELPDGTFSFIVLCNVLHEIPINEWVPTLNKIYSALKEDGFLIILEAKILTKGEKIGAEGFILVDQEEFQELYKIKRSISLSNPENDDKITCLAVQKSELKILNNKDIRRMLSKLEQTTLEKIISIRNLENLNNITGVQLGRKSAFLSQLHINSKIAQLSINE